MIRSRPVKYASTALVCAVVLALACCKNEKTEVLGLFAPDRLRSIAGQDGCTPIDVGNRTLWTFGDTILGTWNSAITVDSTFEKNARMEGMISNSCAFSDVPGPDTIASLKFDFVTEGGRVVQCMDHLPGEDPARVRIWPIDGIMHEGRVYLYFMRITIDREIKGPMPFRFNGIGVALWEPSMKSKGPVRFRRVAMLFGEKEPAFGDSAILKDGFVYLVGHGTDRPGAQAAYVCRVEPGAITRREAYRFLARDGTWTERYDPAAGLFGDVMGEMSLSYLERQKKFLVTYMSRNGELMMCAASTPVDLLKARAAVVYTPPPLPEIKGRPFMFYYSGKEIFHTSRSVYAIYINPAIYQPVLVRIPISMIRR